MAVQSILIIEDDPGWQEIFAEIVSDAGFNPVVVSTYEDAVSALSKRGYILAVVDISLSFEDHAHRGGVEVLKELDKLSPRVPAVVVTGYADVPLAVETLVDLSAVNFFRKEAFDRRKFRAVVEQEAEPADSLRQLSEREREVLLFMGQGCTNKEIAKKMTVSVNTVKKHAQSIYTKLNVGTRAAAVAKAMEGDK